MDSFIVNALAAGIGLAVVGGPLGCFVVWRRMAYFGATLSHAALLGIALGFLLGLNVYVGVAAVCLAVALALVGLEHQRRLAADTLLGILAHAALAFGLIAVSALETLRVDLMAYLFGDILAVAPADLAWIFGGGAAVLVGLAALWRPLLLITVDADLARVDGVRVGLVRLAFMGLIAVVVAAAMKIVGILLVVSMLIIPAAAARALARSPEAMAVLASLAGVLAVVGGLAASLVWDTPAGPSIVAAAAVVFAFTLPLPERA